jgi:predicted RNA-binding Zn ribbon-like protein
MQHREDLPLDLRRRFLSGRPALDLTHTGGEGEYAVWEIIHGPEDLSRWLGVILDVDGIQAGPQDLPPLRALRAAITRAARGIAAERPLLPGDVATINSAAAASPLVPVLRPSLSSAYAEPTSTAALSTLARDAIDLFSSPLAERIRICAAPDCGLLLVDTSRPGRRRWCSMQRCGNLAKVRSYRHKGSD